MTRSAWRKNKENGQLSGVLTANETANEIDSNPSPAGAKLLRSEVWSLGLGRPGFGGCLCCFPWYSPKPGFFLWVNEPTLRCSEHSKEGRGPLQTSALPDPAGSFSYNSWGGWPVPGASLALSFQSGCLCSAPDRLLLSGWLGEVAWTTRTSTQRSPFASAFTQRPGSSGSTVPPLAPKSHTYFLMVLSPDGRGVGNRPLGEMAWADLVRWRGQISSAVETE